MKLTPEIISSRIVDESFLEIVPRQTVIAVLRLQNGTVVIGEAHSLNRANFVYEQGCRTAREDAVRKIWMLEGYAAREHFMRIASEKYTPPFAAGDVVRLNSGGPDMVVERVDDKAHCVWWEDDSQVARGAFHFATLKLVKRTEQEKASSSDGR